MLIASQRSKRKPFANNLLVVILVPFHFAYAGVIVFGSVPAQMIEAKCTTEQVYPPVLIAPNILFVLAYLVALVLFCARFCLDWGDVKQKRSEVPASQILEYERNLSQKKLFE